MAWDSWSQQKKKVLLIVVCNAANSANLLRIYDLDSGSLTICDCFAAARIFPAVESCTCLNSMKRCRIQSIFSIIILVSLYRLRPDKTYGFSNIAPSRSTITDWSLILTTCLRAPSISWDLKWRWENLKYLSRNWMGFAETTHLVVCRTNCMVA